MWPGNFANSADNGFHPQPQQSQSAAVFQPQTQGEAAAQVWVPMLTQRLKPINSRLKVQRRFALFDTLISTTQPSGEHRA